MQRKLALLVDAENISHRDLPLILEQSERQGQVILRAIYGDWQRSDLDTWRTLAAEHNFKVRAHTNAAHSKNAADMALIMDAIEVLYRTSVDVFCLVTNDADYVPLCHKLRESGKTVIGIGYERASSLLIEACDDFIIIEHQTESDPLAQAHVAPPQQPAQPEQTTDAHALLKRAFDLTEDDGQGWVDLSALGMALREADPDFDVKQFGHSSLSKWLQSMPDAVEIKSDKTTKFARLKGYQSLKRTQSHDLLKRAFALADDEAGWVSLSALGMALREADPDFTLKRFGHGSLSKWLQSMSDAVEIKSDKTSKFARLKQAAAVNSVDVTALILESFDHTHTDRHGWVHLSTLGTALRKVDTDFDAARYGHSSLTKLCQSVPHLLEMKLDNGTRYVRLKS